MNRYGMIDVVIGAFYVNVIVQTLISVAGMAQFTQMLWVTHVLLIFGIVILVYYMFKEYKNKKEKSILIILISFIALAASGILALFLYLSLIHIYCIMMELMRRDLEWQGLILWAMLSFSI